MIPGFTAGESAVAACLMDGLDDVAGAAATGMGESLYRKHLHRLRERFVPDWRESLRSELLAVEGSDWPLGRALCDGSPAPAHAHSEGRP